MEKISNTEIAYMLAVIYKKLDILERSVNGGSKLASLKSFYSELRELARKEIERNELD